MSKARRTAKPAGSKTRSVLTTVGRVLKGSGQGLKDAGRALKGSGRGLKDAGRALKGSGQGLKDAGRALKDAGRKDDNIDTAGIKPPKVARVVLHIPEHAGRTVDNFDVALNNATGRFLLAYKYRALLDPALPPDFHATAWTAVDLVRANATADESNDGSTPSDLAAQPALDTLLGALGRIRKVVEITSRPGSQVRSDLHISTPIYATQSLLAAAPAMIRAAKKWQPKFPAVTDTLIANATSAYHAARIAVGRRRGGHIASQVDRADHADEAQLALDVLLDCVDHLRAAAIATLSDTRPNLAAALSAPLESSHSHPAKPDASHPASPAATTTPTAQS